MKDKYLVISLICLLLASCAGNQNSDECEKPVEYKTSALAAVMRAMHDTLSVVKSDIEQGSSPDSLPYFLNEILSAEATDPSDINDTYKSLANNFLKKRIEYNRANPELKLDGYIGVIDACVSCHEVFCGGPMDKIKRLYLNSSSQDKP